MAITYNAWTDLIYIYTDHGGAFSANNAANTAFDYFPDDAAVNDALYFGYQASDSLPFGSRGLSLRNIRFYVGTQFAATSVTFVWEYYNGAWVSLPGVVNGDAILSANQQDVTWDMPEDMAGCTINGVYGYWIRCRISAIDTPTEGGAQSTNKVQCGNNKIVVVGYSATTPCTLDDIYNADVAGGWGVLKRYDNNLYHFSANLTIGGSATQSYFTTKSDPSRSGCSIYFNSDCVFYTDDKYGGSCGNTKIYSSLISMRNSFYGTVMYLGGSDGRAQFIECALQSHGNWWYEGKTSVIGLGDGIIMTDTVLLGCTMGWFGVLNWIGFDASNCTRLKHLQNNPYLNGLQFCGTPVSLRTNQIRGFGFTVHDTIIEPSGSGYYHYLQGTSIFYDPVGLDDNLVTLPYAKDNYHQWFTLSLTVVNSATEMIDGASVVIKDNTGAVVASGSTVAGLYSVALKYLYRIHGSSAVIYTPHTVTISKSGYQTKTIKYTMDRKREEIEVLEQVKDYNFSRRGKVISQ